MRRLLLFIPVFVALLVLSGCGGKGDVTGTVKYKGETMTKGTVMLQVGNNQPFISDIGPDGTYTVKGIPTGTAKIAVNVLDDSITAHFRKMSAYGREKQKAADPENPGGAAPAPPAPDPSSFYVVPQKYAEVNTSGLTLEVKSGKNMHDIDIND
jgi:hypothetical protein